MRELDGSPSTSSSESAGEPQVKPCASEQDVSWIVPHEGRRKTDLGAGFGYGSRAERADVRLDVLCDVLDESGIRKVGNDDLHIEDRSTERS